MVSIGDGFKYEGFVALARSCRKSVGHRTCLEASERVVIADRQLEAVMTCVFDDDALAFEVTGSRA